MSASTPEANRPATDTQLSYKARGLWATLVQMALDDRANTSVFSMGPPTDRFLIDSPFNRLLEGSAKDGQRSIRTGIDELEELGYLRKEVLRHSQGKISGHRWEVFFTPVPEDGKGGGQASAA